MASAPRAVWGDLATTAFVEASVLFRSLDPEARRDLLQLARTVSWEAGELVSGAGDDGFHLLVDGRAAAVRGDLELATLERGAFFGEGRVLGGASAASLVARSAVTAVVFPASVVGAVADRFPKVRRLLEAMHAAREKDAAVRRAP